MNQPFDHAALTRDVRARSAAAARTADDQDRKPSATANGRPVDVPRHMAGQPIAEGGCCGTGCC